MTQLGKRLSKLEIGAIAGKDTPKIIETWIVSPDGTRVLYSSVSINKQRDKQDGQQH